MKRTIATLAALATLAAAPTFASAHSFTARQLSDRHVGTTKAELLAQRDYSQRIVSSLTTTGRWRLASRHATCWSHVAWSHVCNRARTKLRAHRWLAALAARRLAKLYPVAPAIPAWFVADMGCVHRYEGAWDSNTGNGYYGGLQMDLTFQGLYGAEFVARWGTADNWPMWAQLAAAYRAYSSGRGFGPWPNTARACGLI